MRIAVDAMGGDRGATVVAQGALRAARLDQAHYLLVGDPAILEPELAKQREVKNIEIIPAREVIEMTDVPTVAFRTKKDASISVGARLVKEKKADALVSIGNTGAAMAVSLLTLGRIRGIGRPAIATLMPATTGTVILLDAGATVDCDPNNLYEFAVMGSVFAELSLGVKSPKIGLLSNGEESSKGNEVVKKANALFQTVSDGDPHFNFIGNVEGRDIFRGTADVVVCDGFVGNVVLKASEGVAEMIRTLLKEEVGTKLWMKPFLAPIVPAIKRITRKVDYAERGGAPLLGVNGVVIIGHGRSDAYAVLNACKAAERAVQSNLIETIRERVCEAPPPV